MGVMLEVNMAEVHRFMQLMLLLNKVYEASDESVKKFIDQSLEDILDMEDL